MILPIYWVVEPPISIIINQRSFISYIYIHIYIYIYIHNYVSIYIYTVYIYPYDPICLMVTTHKTLADDV